MDTVEQVDVEGQRENAFVRLLIVAGQSYSADQARHILHLINSSMDILFPVQLKNSRK
jgi:hypothetical protein